MAREKNSSRSPDLDLGREISQGILFRVREN